MKRIPLTQGQFAIVNNNIFDKLNQHKWYARWCKKTQSFYAMRVSINNKKHTIYMAREILGLNLGDKRQADHIDHNTLDNRLSNLRIVTHQQNCWNGKNPKGYCWHKYKKKYIAEIKANNKRIYLGYFSTTKAAHNAYMEAKKIYHSI